MIRLDQTEVATGLTPRSRGVFPLAPEPPAPTTGEVLGAAFGIENDVVAALSFFSRRGYGMDADPDAWMRSTDWENSKYQLDYSDRFVGVTSEREARAIMTRIDTEERQRSVLSRGGWRGVLGGMAAGVISPTSLVPVAGWYAGAGRAARAAGGALGVGVGAAAQVAAQELLFQSTQELRTTAESVFNIAGAAVLGGVLGGAAGALATGELSRLGRSASRIPATAAEERDAFGALVGGPASAGAAATDAARGTGELAGALGAERAFSFQDPLIRLQTNELQAARNTVRDLAETPLTLAENAEGIATTIGGSVETRAKMAQGPMTVAIQRMDEAFQDYFFGGRARMAPLRSEIRGLTGRAAGKLTYTEFKRAVDDAMIAGDVHPIPQVQAAAASLRQAYDRLAKEAIDAGVPGFKEAVEAFQRDGLDAGYVYRVYNREAITANRSRFVEVLTRHFIAKQDDLRDSVERLERKAGEKDFEESLFGEQVLTEVNSFAARQRTLRERRAAAKALTDDAGKALKAEDRRVSAEALKAERAAEREQRAVYRALLRDLKRGSPLAQARDLMGFIRQQGGIKAFKKEADGSFKMATRSVEIRSIVDGAKKANIIRSDGLDLDDMLSRAIEHGYFGPSAGLDDLLEAIDDSLKGGKARVSVMDQDLALDQERIATLAREMDQAGVDVTKMTVDDLIEFFGAGRSAEAVKVIGDIEGLAKRFDEAALQLDDIEQAIRAADEFAPEVAEAARSLKAAMRKAKQEANRLKRSAESIRKQADLSPDEVRSIAEETTATILGLSPTRMAMPADIVSGPRGPLKERVLRIPTELVKDFIERDPEVKLRMATRTMATDAALVRKFGSTDMAAQIAKINDEAARAIAANPDRSAKITKAQQAAIRDVTAIRDRLRGNYAMPENPEGLAYRASKVLRNLNYVRLLGGMTLSAIPDIARPVFAHGLGTTLKTLWHPLTKGLRTMRLSAGEVKLAGTALDMVLDSRVMQIADIMDDFGRGSKFERGLSAVSGKFGMVSLMAPWNATMKQFAGVIAQTRMLQIIEKVVAGKASRKEVAYLAAGGIDATVAERIWRQFAGSPVTTKRLPSSASLATPPAPTAGDLARFGRVERVPLAKARGTQSEMEWGRFNSGDHPAPLIEGYADKPVAVRREDGEYLIFDGHHRAVTALNRGDTAMEMHVIDARQYAPELAGRPRAPEISDDDLLRELGVEPSPAVRESQAEAPPARGHGVKDGAVWWANTSEWTDQAAADSYRAFLVRDVDKAIITPGQDKPLWMSTGLGKLIGQFKSFAVASVQRTIIAGMQQRDMATLNGMLMMLGLGAVTYAVKETSRGATLSDDPAKWAVEALDYSGLTGWLSEANNMVEKVTRGTVGMSALTGETATRYASRNALGAAMGPSFDLVGDVLQIVGSAASGDWQASDTHALRKLLPLQNLMGLRLLIDKAEAGVNGMMGVRSN